MPTSSAAAANLSRRAMLSRVSTGFGMTALAALLADRAYGAEFGDAEKSRKLDLFFWSLRGARDP